MKEMNKLVRDNIPDIILKNGDIPIYHVLDEEEYITALKTKMLEEYQEILGAKTKEETLEECAENYYLHLQLQMVTLKKIY